MIQKESSVQKSPSLSNHGSNVYLQIICPALVWFDGSNFSGPGGNPVPSEGNAREGTFSRERAGRQDQKRQSDPREGAEGCGDRRAESQEDERRVQQEVQGEAAGTLTLHAKLLSCVAGVNIKVQEEAAGTLSLQ